MNGLAVAALIGSLSGCGGRAQATAVTAQQLVQTPAVSPTSSTVASAFRHLAHDFGIVRPGSSHTYEFEIRNDSDREWTFGRIKVACSCTATEVSSPSITPGSTAKVKLLFRAPQENIDQAKSVEIHFRETNTPAFSLDMLAAIRSVVTAFPAQLQFGQIGRGAKPSRHLDVYNYGSTDWDTLVATSNAAWLTATASLVPGRRDESNPKSPRQAWRVLFDLDSHALASGKNTTHVQLRATSGQDHHDATVSIDAHVEPLITVIPSQLFFGSVPRGDEASKTILVRFSHDSIPASPSAVQVTHDLGEQLSWSWSKSEGRDWELTAVLKPSVEAGFLEGKLTLAVDAALEIPSSAREVILPIRALVK